MPRKEEPRRLQRIFATSELSCKAATFMGLVRIREQSHGFALIVRFGTVERFILYAEKSYLAGA